jgi:hypothetical protein
VFAGALVEDTAEEEGGETDKEVSDVDEESCEDEVGSDVGRLDEGRDGVELLAELADADCDVAELPVVAV